jgi:hypothetical protein
LNLRSTDQLTLSIAEVDQKNARLQVYLRVTHHGAGASCLAWVKDADFERFLDDLATRVPRTEGNARLNSILAPDFALNVEVTDRWTAPILHYRIPYKPYRLGQPDIAIGSFDLDVHALPHIAAQARKDYQQARSLPGSGWRSQHHDFSDVVVAPCFTAGGLPIPAHIIALDKAGLWKLPDDLTRFRILFSNADVGTPGALLRTLAHLKACGPGRFWAEGTDDFFLGAADASSPPGDIDINNALYLGDMGLGSDQPFALDYRVDNIFCPRVIFLTIHRVNDEWANRWITVANSVEEFTDLIGLTNR